MEVIGSPKSLNPPFLKPIGGLIFAEAAPTLRPDIDRPTLIHFLEY